MAQMKHLYVGARKLRTKLHNESKYVYSLNYYLKIEFVDVFRQPNNSENSFFVRNYVKIIF